MNGNTLQNKRNYFNWFLWIICAVLCLATALTGFYIHYINDGYYRHKEQDVQQKIIFAANMLNQELSNLNKLLRIDIVNAIESGKLKNNQLLSVFKQELQRNKQLFAIGVNYLPYTKPKDLHQDNAFYLNKLDIYPPDANLYVQFANVSIYNTNTVVEKDITTKIAIGFMYADLNLDYLKNIVTHLKLDQAGYAFIVNKKGEFLYHPTQSLIKNQKTLFEVAKENNDAILFDIATRANEGMSGSYKIIDYITGKPARIFYQNLSLQGWTLCAVLFDDYKDAQHLNKAHTLHFCLLVEIIFLLLGLVTVIFSLYGQGGKSSKIWWGFFATTIIVGGMVTIWIWQFTIESLVAQKDDDAILNVININNTTARLTKAFWRVNKTASISILTGVQIQDMVFASDNKIEISGYIWQRAPNKAKIEEFMGIQFSPSSSNSLQKIYELDDANMHTIVWAFKYSSFQEFSLIKYPFNTRKIILELLPAKLEKNIILMPDLDNYSFINPGSLPGMNKITASNWVPKKSFFTCTALSNKQTVLGIDNYMRNYPRLQFNIYVQHVFLQALLSSIIPIVAILLILVSLLLTMTHVSFFSFLSACSAGVFTVAVLHGKFRADIACSEIVYLDYFFLLMYFSIMIFIVESFAFKIFKKTHGFYKQDNLFMKILFLPIFAFIMFVITLWIFYLYE